MSTMKRFLSVFLIGVFILGSITACGSNTSSTKSPDATKAEVSTVSAAGTSTGTRVVTDMEGRKVTLPEKVNKVISLSNNTTVYVFTLAPDKLLGWSFAPKPDAKKFIKEPYFSLPNTGSSSSKSGSFENILKLKPDLIICSDEDEAYKPDELQQQLNIPVVMVDASLEATDKAYNFLGDCLNVQERGKELADYSRKTLEAVKKQVAAVPEEKRLGVYYAEGPAWLQTDVAGNVHTEVLDAAGGKNAANVKEEKIDSMVEVSMEQVLSWNPDVILEGATAAKGNFFSKVYGDSNWAKVKAVQNKKIYKIPSLPFNWFDRPPCPARILGVEWLANLLYPDYVKVDLNHDIKAFYKLFYNYDLTDGEVQELLKGAAAK